MKDVIEKIQLELNKLTALMEEIKLRLSNLPQGSLQIHMTNGTQRCYKQVETNNTYLTTKDKDFISLANKRYLIKIQRNAIKQIRPLENCLMELNRFCSLKSTLEIYEEQPNLIKPYLVPLKDTNEDFAQKWQAKKHHTKWIDRNEAFKTLRGDWVRSKSEVLIADRLFNNEIPYHYEVYLKIDPITSYNPDFLVLNKRTRKTYYWEHFGMMDDPVYCKMALKKLEDYFGAGYIIGENLLVTFESSKYPLNTQIIELMIKSYLK